MMIRYLIGLLLCPLWGDATLAVTALSGFATPSLEPNAQKVVQEAAIVGGVITSSRAAGVNQFVSKAKRDGVWKDLLAVYGFVGAASASHSINWKTPGAYDITWGGTGTSHDADGVAFDGNGYGDTNLNASSEMTTNDTTLGFSCRVESATFKIDIGAWDGGNSPRIMVFNYYGNNMYSDQYNYTGGRVSKANGGSIGVFIGTRRASNDHEIYKDAVSLNSKTTSGGVLPNVNVYVGAANNGGTASHLTSREYDFFFIGNGLTDIQVSDLTDAIENLNSDMGR